MTTREPIPLSIEGTCDPAFAAVEDAFRANFRSRDEIGAAVCVVIRGKTVVDLWGGHRDEERTEPWQRDTLVNTYSVGKGITAMLVLSLVEQGELELDTPISEIWPEFACEGKDKTTLRMLLSHRAGLPGVRKRLEENAMLSWQTMTDALAEQAPYWPTDTAHGYHVNSFGFLVGEPVVRTLRLPFAEALRAQLTERFDADFHIGLPGSEHHRVAKIVGVQVAPPANVSETATRYLATGEDEIDSILRTVYFNPSGLSGFGCVNTAPWRLASIPSANGHGTARAVATLYDLFLNRDVARGGLVGPGLRAEATRIHSDGIDRVLGKPSRFGLGFQLSQPSRLIGGSETGFGHFGYGGTLGFADPETGVAFGYLMNRPGARWQTPRSNALTDALNQSLGRKTED